MKEHQRQQQIIMAAARVDVSTWLLRIDAARCKQCADTGYYWRNTHLFAVELVKCDCGVTA